MDASVKNARDDVREELVEYLFRSAQLGLSLLFVTSRLGAGTSVQDRCDRVLAGVRDNMSRMALPDGVVGEPELAIRPIPHADWKRADVRIEAAFETADHGTMFTEIGVDAPVMLYVFD